MNGSGAATQINTYDEYGVPGPGFSGPFGYAGSLTLTEAGAAPWNMRNRQYHPALGRFLQTDPIGYGDGLNLYAYVGGDPVNRRDPWGLQDNPTTDIPGIDVTGRIPWWRRFTVRWTGVGGIGLVWTGAGIDEVEEIVVTGSQAQQCPSGSRLVFGGGQSGTLFAVLIGGSLGWEGDLSVPVESLRSFSLRGSQVYFGGSATGLVGGGLFAGAGPNASFGVTDGSRPSGFQTSSNWVAQAGAGDGGGVEVVVPAPLETATVAMGPRGALGAYGAGGRRWGAGWASPTIGCSS